MADPIGVANFLCERIAENTASDENATDYTISLADNGDTGQFAMVSLQEQTVYLVTVQEARFVPRSLDSEGGG